MYQLCSRIERSTRKFSPIAIKKLKSNLIKAIIVGTFLFSCLVGSYFDTYLL
jgi:hypothetical protein